MPITAHLSERRTETSVERVITFDPSTEEGVTTIRHDFRGEFLPGPIDRWDTAALALVFHAMRGREDLHIAGPVSRTLLENLEEFQRAWAKWRPGLYHPVQITAEAEVDGHRPDTRDAVLAYSGGVDANFSLLRHVGDAAGRQRRQVKAAILVHGFDIPLDNPAMFEVARRNAESMLGAFEVPLVTVTTDWRRVGRRWENEFGSGLAACLSAFQNTVAAGLLGSDEDYGSLVLPWGSNPATNPFLCSDDFHILTDGTGYSRSEKVALIARFPHVADRLRVCWENPTAAEEGGNCGRCEKCLRTKMNFLAVGARPGKSLADPITVDQIKGLRLRNLVQLAYLEDIQRTAEKSGITDPWTKALKTTVLRNRFTLGTRQARRSFSLMVRSLSRRAGIGSAPVV